jgi:hypothetical protein
MFTFRALIVLVAATLSAADYTVDGVNGSNANPGTPASPFATIQKAVDVLTANGTSAAAGTITVRAGTYRESVVLKRGGTGAAGRLVIQAYRDGNGVRETVVVSGLDPLAGPWTTHSGSIRKATMGWSLDDGNTSVDAGKRGLARDQIFVDGLPMVHARWPDVPVADAMRLTTANLAQMDSGEGKSDTTLDSSFFTDAALGASGLGGTTINGALVTYLPGTKCFTRTGRIAYSSGSTYTINSEQLLTGNASSASTFTPATGAGSNGYDYLHDGCDYYLWGRLEFLNAPGEWFRNPADGTLYMRFPDSGDGSGHVVEAKRREFALSISTPWPDTDQADYITIDGLRIVGATMFIGKNCNNVILSNLDGRYLTHMEDQRWTQYQARWAQFLIVNGTDNSIEDCDFLAFERGIELNGARNHVSNCTFRDTSPHGTAGAALSVNIGGESAANDGSQANRNVLEGCTILGGGYTLIQLGVGLDVRWNEVVASHRQGSDVGAISAAPNTDLKGTEVAWNRVYDSYPQVRSGDLYGAFGIYFDRDARHVLVHHNEVWGMTGPPFAFLSLGSSSVATASPRKAFHNTFRGSLGPALENGANGFLPIEYRNNIQQPVVVGASRITVGGNLASQNDDIGWIDEPDRDFRLRSTSTAINVGETGLTDLSGAAFHGASAKGGTVSGLPDAGSHEGQGAWSRVAGATVTSAQAADLVATITAVEGSTATVTIDGLPLCRQLPATTRVRIGGATAGGRLLSSLDASTGLYSVSLVDVPVSGSGSQFVRLSIDGSTWIDQGTQSVDPVSIASIAGAPSTGFSAAGGEPFTIHGNGFAADAPATWSRTISIANPSGTALSNYPVRVILDTAALVTAGHLQADGDDLRFSDGNGTDLAYCFDGPAIASSAAIWVKVPSIPSGGTSLTLTYGYPSRTMRADLESVFHYYDDFADGLFDGSVFNALPTTASETGGQLWVIPATNTGGGNEGFSFRSDFAFPATGGFIIESKISIAPKVAGRVGWKGAFGCSDGVLGINNGGLAYYSGGWLDPDGTAQGGAGAVSSTLGTGMVSNVQVGLAVDADRVGLSWYESYALIGGRSAAVLPGTVMWTIGPNGAVENFTLAVDEIRIRPFVANGATATVGAETTVAGNTLVVTIDGQAVTVTRVDEHTLTGILPAALAGSLPRSGTLTVTTNGHTGSGPFTWITTPAVPATPSLTAGLRQIAVAWAAVPSAATYTVRYGTSSGSLGTVVSGLTGTATTLSGLADGQTYFVAVQAGNHVGTSALGATSSAATAPPAPSGLTAVVAAGRITLDWSSAALASTYTIRYGISGGALSSVINGITATDRTISGLVNGTAYDLTVEGVNAAGSGDATASVTATPLTAVAAPAVPGGLAAVAGDGRVQVTWGGVSGATSYSITYGAGPGALTSSQNGISDLHATIAGLVNGTTYWFAVSASNAIGASAASAAVSATPVSGGGGGGGGSTGSSSASSGGGGGCGAGLSAILLLAGLAICCRLDRPGLERNTRS